MGGGGDGGRHLAVRVDVHDDAVLAQLLLYEDDLLGALLVLFWLVFGWFLVGGFLALVGFWWGGFIIIIFGGCLVGFLGEERAGQRVSGRRPTKTST